MDIEKTKEYYSQLDYGDLCQCDDCKNYVKEIKTSYPLIDEYLSKLGIDITKPFETAPIDFDEETIFYTMVQYVVMGTSDGFENTKINDVDIWVTESHPMTNITEPHFVIEICPVYLKRTM